MEHKRRLFIYDRKEVGVLIFLGLGVALFAFTLGVHLGKEVSPKPIESSEHTEEGHEPVETAPEQAPNRTEVAEQVKGAPEAADESLDQSLRDEVAKTGIQVENPKPLSLPDETNAEKAAHAPAPQAAERKAPAVQPKTPHAETHTAPAVASSGTGAYTLQVGSFPSQEEAQPVMAAMIEQGLPAETREVELKGKGKWYRVYVGRFVSVGEAEKAGQEFKKEKRVRAFVVVKAQ